MMTMMMMLLLMMTMIMTPMCAVGFDVLEEDAISQATAMNRQRREWRGAEATGGVCTVSVETERA
eukprot:3682004-Pyramimonas_sp.AAC.1